MYTSILSYTALASYCCMYSFPLFSRPLNGPLFFLDLVLDAEGSHYSQSLPTFQPTLVKIFDRGISSTHSVPMVEKVKLSLTKEQGTNVNIIHFKKIGNLVYN